MDVKLPVEIGSVEVLRMQPGDWLVCSSDYPLNDHARLRIRAELQELLGTQTVIVCNPGFSLGILRKEMAEAMSDPKAQQVAESEGGE